MASPAFDTLRFQQKLSEVLDPRTATVMAEAFAEATQNFASKSDLESLRSEMKAESALTRQESKSDAALLRADVNAFRNEIRADLAEKLRAQTIALVGGLGVLMAVITALGKLFH